MRKLHLSLFLIAGLCSMFGLQVGIKECCAASVYNFLESYYQKDGAPYSDYVKEENTAENTLVQIENSGELSVGSYSRKAYLITNYGMHQLYSYLKVTNANNELVKNQVFSQFEDNWIVRAPSGVTEGEMTIGITLYGNHEGDDNNLFYDLSCYDGCSSDTDNETQVNHIEEFTFPMKVVKVTFYYDVDTIFRVVSQMEVSTRIGWYNLEGVSGESHIDFGHSAVITSVDLPEGHTLETESGTTYPLDYTPPGTDADTDTGTTGGGGGGGGCFISNMCK